MIGFYDAISHEDFEKVKHMVNENHEIVHIKWLLGLTPLDYAIRFGTLDIVQFLWKMGSRPNLDAYDHGINTPAHHIKDVAIPKWVFTEGVLTLRVLKIKNEIGWTPLDRAIACGKPEIANYLWEIGGRSNLEGCYNSPVHHAIRYRHTETLKWAFKNKVFPLRVLNAKDCNGRTPLDIIMSQKEWETAAFLQHHLFNPVFLAMQLAKHDYQCVLRRLPNELLDMVVDKVAAHFHLKVVW